MRSDILKQNVETLPHRALLMSAGVSRQDLHAGKPFIGVANSFNTLIPGHIHLDELTAEVCRGIRDAGGVPFQWGVPGVCDGVAMFVEMRLSLPSREHIADNVEIMVLSHCLDGWVGVTNCDKITPGMLMAAARLDLPAVILTGGPMKANIVAGQKCHPIAGFGLVGRVKAVTLRDYQARVVIGLDRQVQIKEDAIASIKTKGLIGEKYVEITSEPSELIAQHPQMKAAEVCDAVIHALAEQKYRFLRVNFANPDMVGHTGNLEAAIRSVETLDQALGRLKEAIARFKGVMVVTADHGNVEQMEGKFITSHTLNPVPFFIWDPQFQDEYQVRNDLEIPQLANVAATLLNMLGFEKPAEYLEPLIDGL